MVLVWFDYCPDWMPVYSGFSTVSGTTTALIARLIFLAEGWVSGSTMAPAWVPCTLVVDSLSPGSTTARTGNLYKMVSWWYPFLVLTIASRLNASIPGFRPSQGNYCIRLLNLYILARKAESPVRRWHQLEFPVLWLWSYFSDYFSRLSSCIGWFIRLLRGSTAQIVTLIFWQGGWVSGLTMAPAWVPRSLVVELLSVSTTARMGTCIGMASATFLVLQSPLIEHPPTPGSAFSGSTIAPAWVPLYSGCESYFLGLDYCSRPVPV